MNGKGAYARTARRSTLGVFVEHEGTALYQHAHYAQDAMEDASRIQVLEKQQPWSFYGSNHPKWSLVLGWGGLYGTIPAYLILGTVLLHAPYAGLYGLVAGTVALLTSIKHRSYLLMGCAFPVMFSYIIAVLLMGVYS